MSEDLEKKSRSHRSLKNISYSLVGQVVGLLVSFILRIIFVKQLNEEYLGIDSLFTSIVSMLTLAELGVGSAINFSLYKPIAEEDIDKIKSLMFFYKRIYKFIGCFILILGILITPLIIKNILESSDVKHLYFIFFLFVLNSSISYFYSYKKTLIIADQYRHITVLYRYVFYVLMVIIQGVILLLFKNYVMFLLVMLLFTFLENYTVSKKADKLYPYLLDKSSSDLDKITKKIIAKNTYAMSFHKIGGVIVNSTDNLIISKFVGLSAVGLYSNYFLITNALNLIFSQIFNSIVASIGNLGVEEDKEKIEKTFDFVFYCCFLLVSFSTIMLTNLLNPFISIWLGEKYTLPISSVYLISINFFIIQIRRAVLSFRDALGLYWYDRYKPLLESLLNLVFSIYLVNNYGLNGVFLGTIISMILTSLWIEPYILYKYAFKKSSKKYYKIIFKYSIITFALNVFIFKVNNFFINTLIMSNFLKFVFIIIASLLIYIVIMLLISVKNIYFKKIVKLIRKI